MSYTVIARRWRPQQLSEVVGQRAVTQTLRNAVSSDRIAQAFVFAGPRGVGKTTTARILARMLNCVNGPTADPCGICDACTEVAESRDMDVLEIDAATHTGIDNVREVIISGLAIMPARDRYKIFIIDEVHQLSASSFNALLKSIEEPPPHVVFIMATTAPDKIPDTIVSRAQVFEFKTISSRAIADQLKKIAVADGLTVSDEAMALMARAAEGSMRDAETAFDQVLAFAGTTITVEDVATVLGLVGRDLLFDVLAAVADENGAAAFELAGRAVESGYDLRLLCRELTRLVRDLLVLQIDPTRFTDPDIAPEADHDRLKALLPRFSREDLLRSFDVLTRAESEIKLAAEPRYHLEMALLRWIHLRKLTPLSDLIERLEGAGPIPPGPVRTPAAATPTAPARRPAPSGYSSSVARRVSTPPGRTTASGAPAAAAAPPSGPRLAPTPALFVLGAASNPVAATAHESATLVGAVPAGTGGASKDAFLAEIKRSRAALYGSSVAQADRIDFEADRVVIAFAAGNSFAANLVVQKDNKAWLEGLAQQVAGRKMTVVTEVVNKDAGSRQAAGGGRVPAAPSGDDAALKAEAMAHPTVQAMLEIFPADITSVTELKKS